MIKTLLTWIYVYCINQIYVVSAVTVSSLQIQNNDVAEKGTDVTLVCSIEQFVATQSIYVYKTETAENEDHNYYLDQCLPNDCAQGGVLLDNKYRITADNRNVYILIKNLTISHDDKWWTCRDNRYKSQQQMKLIVYVSPVSLVLSEGLNGGDLQAEDVTLKCQSTNCVFPVPPLFQWFYQKTNTQWLLYTKIPSTAALASCSGSERLYSAVLHLDRYSTWPLQPTNVETTVKFQCRLSFPTLISQLESTQSGNVTYAVRVAAVILRYGDITPTSTDTIDVISGVPQTFSCTTSTSRPLATIVWYVGNTVKQRGTSIYYKNTPDYGDNGKRIYCKAFNIQSEANAIPSNSPTFNINVKVISVTLYDGSSSPGSNDEIIVTENQEKTLTCRTGDSNPVSTIVWYINSHTKQNGTAANFIFTPTNNDHGKRVHCRAYNIQPPEEAVVSASPKLYIKVLAGTPSLTNWTSGNPQFLSGENVTLICRSTATRPVVSVVWKKGTVILGNVNNSESINSNGLVILMSKVTFTPQKGDNGTIVSCETSITSQNPQRAQESILVWWSPSTPSIPINTFPWLEGQNGKQVKCESGDYGNPVADVLWLSPVGTPAATVINFPMLTKNYHGQNVTCQLKNIFTVKLNRTVKSQTIQLDIQYKADIALHIDNLERYSIVRNEGQSLTAVCSARGNPVPTVTWQGQATGNAQLMFTDIDRRDHGGYRCSARASSSYYPNYDFSNETTLLVTVNYAPNVTVGLSNSDPTENSPLRITCEAVSRPDYYTYTSMVQTWEGVEIPNVHKPANGVIDIQHVQLQDSGTYTCMVNNGIRDRNQQMNQIGNRKVMVKVSPKLLLEGIYTFVGAIGASSKITVPFYCYPEIRSVVFRLENGSLIRNSNKYEMTHRRHIVREKFYGYPIELEGYIAELHIRNVEMRDFAMYTLVLTNDVGLPKEWKLEHISESKPTVPMSFNYTGIVEGVPTFSFVGGFNGGHIQTFIVETVVYGTYNWIEQKRFNETDGEFVTDDRLTYRFNITGLQPNTYDIRILAENSIGKIKEEEAPTLRFTIKNREDEPSSRPVAVIAGGSSTAVVIIAVIAVVVIFIRNRRLKNKDDGSNRRKMEDLGTRETSYDNLTSHDDTHHYTAVEPETAFQYETLQESLKGNTATDTYEKLQVQDERTSASVSAVTEKSATTSDTTAADSVYENLKV